MKRCLFAILSALPTGISVSVRGSIGSARKLLTETHPKEAAQIDEPQEELLSRGLSATCPGFVYFNVDVSFSYTEQPYDLGCGESDFEGMAKATQYGIRQASGLVYDNTYKQNLEVTGTMCEDPQYVGLGKDLLSELESTSVSTTNSLGQRQRGLCGSCWPYNGGGGGQCSDCNDDNCDDDTQGNNNCQRRLYEYGGMSPDFDERLKPPLEKVIAEEIAKVLPNVTCLSTEKAQLESIIVTVYQKALENVSDGCSAYIEAKTDGLTSISK